VADNLADRFEEMADAAGGRLALVHGRQRVTYSGLEAQANRLAHHLAAHGVGPGDHVGLVGRNSVPWVAALLACFKLRAVPVNVNYRYVAAELAELFADCGAVALVVDGDLVDECAKAVAALPLPSPEPHHAVVIGDDVGALAGRAVTYDRALAGSSARRDFGPRSGDDVNILYTGGTTGRPKGVVWRQADTYHLVTGGNGNGAAVAAARRSPGEPSAVVLPAGPFAHSSSQWVLLGSLLAGRTVVVLDRFDPAAVWELCESEGVQTLAITGDAMARPLLDALGSGRNPPPGLRVVSSSGGVLSPATKDELARALPGATVVDAFGATETGLLGTSPAADGNGSSSPELRVNGVADTIVVDESGRPVRRGETGMLAKTGPIPLRYHNDPEKTARTFITHEGTRYAVPGDVARLEHDGTITVLGRQSSCINTGGEKVYPTEVENVLKAHPAIEDCLVVGAPDDRWGQRVAAIVAVRGDLTLDDLQRHARGALAGYKVPRALYLVDHIERHPSGKPDYRWASAVTG
jgi:3-oxocholest-4-en-26-oate---CoA ligase